MADEVELGPLSDDALTGGYRIFQRTRGHRYSLDDTVTAWEAARCAPTARRCLDLGSGIGSVLLMLAYKLPAAQMTAIEAQAVSFELLGRNVARNGVAGRARLQHGDLRDAAVLSAAGTGFDLVTGTPPYQPPGRGTVSPDSQRAHARVELRGGVEDYLAAAGQVVARDGWVVVCGDARTPERVDAGAAAAGLGVCSRRHVVPAASYKEPLFSVWTLRRLDAPDALHDPAALVELPAFHARDASGGRTEAARALRRFFDLPLPEDEAPSPRQRARGQRVAQAETPARVAGEAGR